MKEICVKCQRKMHVHVIGVYVLEFKNKELTEPYKLWAGDLMKCQTCGYIAITRFGNAPLSGEWHEDFFEKIEEAKQKGRLYKFY